MTPGYEARSGDEYDVVTDWRKLICCLSRPGVCSATKRRMRRRGRRYARNAIREQLA